MHETASQTPSTAASAVAKGDLVPTSTQSVSVGDLTEEDLREFKRIISKHHKYFLWSAFFPQLAYVLLSFLDLAGVPIPGGKLSIIGFSVLALAGIIASEAAKRRALRQECEAFGLRAEDAREIKRLLKAKGIKLPERRPMSANRE